VVLLPSRLIFFSVSVIRPRLSFFVKRRRDPIDTFISLDIRLLYDILSWKLEMREIDAGKGCD
jgi:hypothetical protein